MLLKTFLYLVGFVIFGAMARAGSIVFVVAGDRDEPPAPSAADLVIAGHVEASGHTVTYVNHRDAEEVTRDAADAADAVYVSDSVASNQIASELVDHPTPVIFAESFAYDDMGWTDLEADIDFGKVLDVMSITIVAPDHPLSAGLTGTVPVYDTLVTMSGGKPGPEATVVATIDGDPNGKAAVFVYEKGAKLAGGGIAPATNIGFFLFGSEENNVPNAMGLRMLDAALNYIVPPVVKVSPSITALERDGDGSVRVKWTSVPGVSYAVDFTSDLASSNWDEVNDSVPSGGDTTSFTISSVQLVGAEEMWIRIRLVE